MRDIKLTTSEMTHLWGTYINDSMANCVLQYFLMNVDNNDIKGLLQFALKISQDHLLYLTDLFEKEKFPIPVGFHKQDVNKNASRLFSDEFYLYYLKNMAFIGGNGYSLALGTSARKDVRNFFIKAIQSSSQLYDKSVDVLLEKGLFVRPAQINTPTKVDFVTKHSFLTGWFGERRPLTSVEIMNLSFNIERNDLGRALLTGFQQVAQDQDVKEFLSKGIKIASKHVEIFGSILSESGLPTPMVWNTLATESIDFTFSDKLIMFHSAALTAASTSHYGTSIGTSPRRDIGLHYARLTLEVLKYGEDGANIMIKNGWLEQPPTATDREALKNKNLNS
ncbi:hypothetical protein JOC85_004172 [Bacillus mesophilus]|uniref:DUF3231 family protein n=1 Tax=Bacillus mesophilus TaxID=1808955 RepID=A0A6M0QCK3_9BACI|nr:DUF3231 family protein [Bacillus mesophilus]MBM7663300.1 hypothetical protein [Bacillus mesophilus]NEY74084.1 DUF3231 family protein [Bacillus mesophilus]